MADGGGTSLGSAHGTVVIDAQVTQAAQQIAAFSQQSEKELQRVTNAVNQLAGAFGVSLGAAGAAQLTRFIAGTITGASNLNESINKVSVAFDASSQEILEWSQNSATALGQSQQQALEAASSFGLLFETMGLASGQSAEMSKGLVELATDIASINNISPEEALQKLRSGLVGEAEPLRTVGVLLDETSVQAKAMEMGLAATTSALTQQDKVLARYQLILDQTQITQGDFSRTSREMANQTRILNAEWADLQDTMGKTLLPGATLALQVINGYLADELRQLKELIAVWDALGAAMGRIAHLDFSGPPPKPLTGVTGGGGVGSFSGDAQTAPDLVKIDKAWADHFDKTAAMTKQANDALDQENNSYLARRARSEEQYQENVANSAADFAKGRMRAQEDYENSILDIMRAAQARDARLAEDHARDLARMQSDSAKRLSDLQEDLDRNNAQKRLDSADKVAEMAADHDKAIADKRQDSADRLLDIEKDYARQQEDATRQHQTNRLEAAARLDARALFFEDKRFEDEQAKATEAHQEKVDDEKTKLQKALDNLNESYNEKLADEQKALDKSIQQANEAHQRQVDDEKEALQQRIDDANDAYTRQLADAKAADAQRITDMAAHFEEQKTREDEDQRDRMGRMADDHTAEMTQMDTEHGERITQIGKHAQDERDALDAEFRKQLHDLGVHNDAYDTAEAQHQKKIKLSQAIFQEEEKRQLADTQLAMLKILAANPLLDTTTKGLLDTAIIALGQQLVTFDTNIGLLNEQFAALPANPYVFNTTKPDTTPTIVPAALGVSSAGGVMTSAAAGGITVNTAFTINAVSGQTAQDLYTLIDARILRTVQLAAGRI